MRKVHNTACATPDRQVFQLTKYFSNIYIYIYSRTLGYNDIGLYTALFIASDTL